MRYLITAALIAFTATAFAAPAHRAPDYRTIKMEIEVNKPANEVWAKIGKYCDISAWLAVDCKIVAGDGGIGTVRSLANGRVHEILVGKTDLSYGYTQPPKEGAFYNLYHGFMEAKPITRKTSRIVYTLFYDVSDMPNEAAKQADMAQRRSHFEAALKKMKQIAEQ
ncbi:MAG: SRPBCC family protein [Steroidobacteraceae bacterium]